MLSGLPCDQASLEETPHWNAKRQDNFFKHGEFTKLDINRVPVGWDNVEVFNSGNAKVLENPKGIIQLKCSDDGGQTFVSTTLELPQGIEFVTVLARMRGPTVVRGESKDAGAGMFYSLVANSGKKRVFPRVEPLYEYGSLWRIVDLSNDRSCDARED